MTEDSAEYDSGAPQLLRRDEGTRLQSQEGYPIYLHNVGGKEPDGKPTRLGKWTFGTKMVREIVLDHVDGQVLNACAGKTRLDEYKRGIDVVRNDIDESIDADLHVDVREIHEHFEPKTFDSAILDPPFDPGRAAKLYEGWHGQEYSHARDAVGELVKPGGTVVELGWNSWSLADKDGWECTEHHIFRQSSFKGDVHLVVATKVNQQRLVTDGGRAEYAGSAPRAVRRDEGTRLQSQEGYPIYLHNVGGKEPDGKPTRLGKWTFGTKMVREIVLDHVDGKVLNACAGKTRLEEYKRGIEVVRNDIDESIDADLHVDVREIHEHFEPESFDDAVLDPPFDPGRAAKLYEGWHGQEYSHARDAVGELVRPGGSVVELGWNSWSLADKGGWECTEHHIFRQSSFKGDVHLVVATKVNQKRLVTDGGVPKKPKQCYYCGEEVPAHAIPCGHGIYWRAKCPEHGWEPEPMSLERFRHKARWIGSRIGRAFP